jgi:thioesterase domain-containing protein
MERPETSGWSALADDVTVEIVPGDHMSIHFPPHAVRLARMLEQRLERSAGRSPDHGRPREGAAATSTDRTA